MKILIIGGGGREHALAWKVAQSKQCTNVFIAPGNAGTALEAKCQNVDIDATDVSKLLTFAQSHQIDLTIVGPEAPLALGIVNIFTQHNLPCFGPTQQAAQLESSKTFCKDFLIKNNIPTAKYQSFTRKEDAIAYLQEQSFPIVIKADGLAAGKGVIIATDMQQATAAVIEMLEQNRFGDAGAKIVIEDFLSGIELSYIAMVDGENVLPLASSQDHKRLLNGDQGPNTGGMGAYSPAPHCTAELEHTILTTIMQPSVDAMRAAGTPYTGFLYAGLMIDNNHQPKVLEFNCRLGDPETQPLLMRMQSDLLELIEAALDCKLDQVTANWDPRSALCVVMASEGYPNAYPKGASISGLNNNTNKAHIFHAATKQVDKNIMANGGRVLSVTALGHNLTTAKQEAYRIVKKIHWEPCYYRTDIGHLAENMK